MGYHISIMDISFRIQSHQYADMMDHLIKWHTKLKSDKAEPLKWIDHDQALAMLNEGDILAYFDHWGYRPTIDITTGDINGLDHHAEKLGSEGSLWEQIAPWVDDESYMNCQGEDHELWRWYWRQGRFFEVEAEISYPDPIEMGVRHIPAPHLDDELNAARVANGWDDPSQPVDDLLASQPVKKTPPDTNYALNALRGKNASHI